MPRPWDQQPQPLQGSSWAGTCCLQPRRHSRAALRRRRATATLGAHRVPHHSQAPHDELVRSRLRPPSREATVLRPALPQIAAAPEQDQTRWSAPAGRNTAPAPPPSRPRRSPGSSPRSGAGTRRDGRRGRSCRPAAATRAAPRPEPARGRTRSCPATSTESRTRTHRWAHRPHRCLQVPRPQQPQLAPQPRSWRGLAARTATHSVRRVP
mmetsp:Transcript_26416/g.85035  ORF Transcript_26416/g.85035 Transcript_26416/m.85035 type:complete len:210 (+) Transcript_26416:201-830(+)